MTLLLVIGACLIPGRILFTALFSSRPEQQNYDPLTRWFASLGLGVIGVGWLAFLLAELGLYSWPRLAIGWLVGVGVLAFFYRPQFNFNIPAGQQTRLQYLLLLIWLPIASYFFLRPHEFILGGADAGVYVNLAANIAHTGRIIIDDPTLAALDPALYPALLRSLPPESAEGASYYLFPAFNLDDEHSGRIIPQFFHLPPVWQAIAHTFGGVWANLQIIGLWALLGTLAVYLIVRQFAGWPAGLLALAGLTVNGLQVWFARYPTTESFNQYLFWLGIWSFGLWLQERSKGWGFLAGAALGSLFLVRIDSYFLLALPLLTLGGLTLTGRSHKNDLWFYLPMGLLFSHSLLHVFFITRPYFNRIVAHEANLFGNNPWLLFGGLAMMAGTMVSLIFFRRQLLALGRLRPGLSALLISFILLLATYGWFIRPYGVEPGRSWFYWYGGGNIPILDQENFIRLGWYLSPIGVWLGVLGLCLMVWHIRRDTAAIIGIGLFFTTLFLWRNQANPVQIYTMRRYIPVVMPLFIIAATYLISRIYDSRLTIDHSPFAIHKFFAFVLAFLWLGGLAWSARGFINQVDYRGLIGQMEAWNSQLAPHSVLIVNHEAAISLGDYLGTPFHFLYGHDVFTLRDPAGANLPLLVETIKEWQASGRDVYWMGEPTILDTYQLPYTPLHLGVAFQTLEASYDHKPTALTDTIWALPFARIEK